MGLQMGESDPKYAFHRAFYEKSAEADLLVLENVCEYNMSEVLKRELPDSQEWSWKVWKIDPRLFGFAAARPRAYGLAWRKSKFSVNKVFNFEEVLDCLQATPAMDAQEYFYMNKEPTKLSASEVTWLKVKIEGGLATMVWKHHTT